jgi:hypothetical protein
MELATEPALAPSLLEYPARPTQQSVRIRRLAVWGGLGAIAVGAGAISALVSRRRGLVLGGAAALALGALRWQFARWFTPTPDYEREGTLGRLEVRHYPVQIEARTELAGHDLESALAAGYGRLACYVFGANAEHEEIERTTPVLLAVRDGAYSLAFVMPDRESLPVPDDLRVELCAVPERRVAVLKFRGGWSREHIARQERALLEQLAEADLEVRGGVMLACYDSPTTLPALRRNELWIDVV